MQAHIEHKGSIPFEVTHNQYNFFYLCHMPRKITINDFRKISPIAQEDIDLAAQMAEEMGLLENSITGGKGSVHGFLGEILVARALGIKQANSRDYDLITSDGTTIEVKTKRCTTPPRLEYEGSVAKFNPNQKCAFYAFTRIMEDFSAAWIIGGIEREQFFELAVQREVGQRDPNDTPGVGFDFKASCYNLVYRHLKPINYYNEKVLAS